MKTISIADFPIKSEYVYAPLATKFNEDLKDIFIRQTRDVYKRQGQVAQMGQVGQVVATPVVTTANQPSVPAIIHPMQQATVCPKDDDDDIQDTEEYVEENLALDEVEKEMIRKALEKHHGKMCIRDSYNGGDNTINSFKIVAKTAAADSVEFRQIQVYAADAAKLKTLADSIYNAIKGGANFVELAKKYGQTGDSNWMTAAQYEGAQIDGDNLKFISAINSTSVNELVNLPLGQANVILQVTNKKAVKDKYKVAVVKREVEFSKETYNRAYNDFSQFIAANPDVYKRQVSVCLFPVHALSSVSVDSLFVSVDKKRLL